MSKELDAENCSMEVGKLQTNRIAPEDRCNFAYLIHFMLGAGNLLPWNALITAVDYFGYLYPNEHIDKVFSVAYMGSSLPVLVVLMSWTNWGRRPSVRLRMNLGFSMFVASLLIVPIMDWTYTHGVRRSGRAYCVTIAAVALCGLADGLVGGSLIGSVGELPRRYMQAVFAGTACSGVLLSTLRIITKASLPQTPQGLRTSAHLYFIVSTLIVLGCIVCFNILGQLSIMQHYRCSKNPVIGSHISLPEGPPSSSTTIMLGNTSDPTVRPKFWAVWKRIRCLTVGVLVTYIVTLSIFPGYITENVQSNALHDWYPILLITTYNASDLVGKCSTAAYVPKSTKKVTWACVARLLFYPLFAACLHGPAFFRTEIPVMILTSALGMTNGYLTSTLMILAPKSVPVAEAETAGIVMALFLGIGLAGGSVLGWFWLI
ncbi:equilibrative nucleotide transporter 8 [Magnolia sinica]|uniref:equilibrative nucleotide transporter 8 n=1 Tax=Magnolia sinica TaxID=86752 RepID=UPI00265B6B90|nr:equilibrative nucleotide transporter 8 [Magnolia sinica]